VTVRGLRSIIAYSFDREEKMAKKRRFQQHAVPADTARRRQEKRLRLAFFLVAFFMFCFFLSALAGAESCFPEQEGCAGPFGDIIVGFKVILEMIF
jgi:hypothetical protein